MVEDVIIVEYEEKYREKCVEMAADAWPIVSSIVSKEDVPKLMNGYVSINESVATWKKVAKIGDDIVGFLFGRLKKDENMKFKINSIKILNSLYKDLKSGKYGKIDDPILFFKEFMKTEKKIAKNTPKNDGEVVLFVVSENFRGKKIGTKLLDLFMEFSKKNNAKKIVVYSDDLSNWKFYEIYGFSRVSSFSDDLNSYFKKEQSKGFIYQYEIK